MHKLTWAEAMHVDGREFFPNVREQIEVPLFAERGVMSTLHEDLRAAKREGFLDLLINLGVRDHVGVRGLFPPPERAKFTVDVADVGVIDIPIDAEGDDLVAAPFEGVGLGQFATTMRQRAEGFQGQGIKLQRVRRRNAVAIPSLLQQLIHGGSVIRSEGRGNDSP